MSVYRGLVSAYETDIAVVNDAERWLCPREAEQRLALELGQLFFADCLTGVTRWAFTMTWD